MDFASTLATILILAHKKIQLLNLKTYHSSNFFGEFHSSDNTKWYWGGGEFTVVTKSGRRYKFDGVSKKEIQPFVKKVDAQIELVKKVIICTPRY